MGHVEHVVTQVVLRHELDAARNLCVAVEIENGGGIFTQVPATLGIGRQKEMEFAVRMLELRIL